MATVSTVGAGLGRDPLDAAVRRMERRLANLHNTVYMLFALAVIHYLLSPGIYLANIR
jgi:DMSO/TMAO reductase YedYZ heme-binding membrane subunit